MKRIIYLVLLIILISCSKYKNTDETNIPINIWNTVWSDIDNEKIDQITKLLKTDNNKEISDIETITKTWTENNIQISEDSKKIKYKIPVITTTPKSSSTDTWILTEEEINIIENTTDWEIDKLIDILFKDLN